MMLSEDDANWCDNTCLVVLNIDDIGYIIVSEGTEISDYNGDKYACKIS